MNLNEAQIVLRRRGALEVTDLTLRSVRSLAPKETLRLSAAVLIPCYLLCLTAWYQDLDWVWTWLAALALARLAELPFLHFMGERLFDSRATAGSAIRASRHSWWRYLTTVLIFWTFLGLGALVVVGWFWVAGHYFYLPAVSVLEQAQTTAALRRSKQLVRRRDSSAFQMMFVHLLMRSSAVVITEVLGQACVEHLLDVQSPMDSLFEDGGSPFAVLGLFLAVPYSATFQFLSYTNERTVQDGWDIQVRFFGLSKAPRRGTQRAA